VQAGEHDVCTRLGTSGATLGSAGCVDAAVVLSAESDAVVDAGAQVIGLELRVEVHGEVVGTPALNAAMPVALEHCFADATPVRGVPSGPPLGPVPARVVALLELALMLVAAVDASGRLLVELAAAALRADRAEAHAVQISTAGRLTPCRKASGRDLGREQ
jgi:hypothetical protein